MIEPERSDAAAYESVAGVADDLDEPGAAPARAHGRCAECEDKQLRAERIAMIVGMGVGVVVGAACAWVLFGRRV